MLFDLSPTRILKRELIQQLMKPGISAIRYLSTVGHTDMFAGSRLDFKTKNNNKTIKTEITKGNILWLVLPNTLHIPRNILHSPVFLFCFHNNYLCVLYVHVSHQLVFMEESK